jgi:hypothetical protein
VALHLVGQELQVGPFRVYHNPFAELPLPPQWFQQSGDCHLKLADEMGEVVPRWEERCVT